MSLKAIIIDGKREWVTTCRYCPYATQPDHPEYHEGIVWKHGFNYFDYEDILYCGEMEDRYVGLDNDRPDWCPLEDDEYEC